MKLGSDSWWSKYNERKAKDRGDPSVRFLFKDGHPIAILRPENVERKLAGVAAIKDGTPHEQAQPAFDELLSEQPHQFVGYASRSGSGDILDKWGKVIDTLRAGDSFVGCGYGTQLQPPMFMQTGRMHNETWDGMKVLVLPRPELKLDSNTGIVIESPNPADLGAIVLRGGATGVDCHIPTLNRIITGDPGRDYRTMSAEARSFRGESA